MLSDNEKDKILSIKKLSEDKDFYNNVFKRTEKVVSVVFYILTYLPHTELSLKHENNLSEKAFLVHERGLATLTAHRFEAAPVLEALIQALVSLESAFRIATAAGFVSNDALFIITTEIDAVVRTINNNYMQALMPSSLPAQSSRASHHTAPPRTRPAPSAPPTPVAVSGHDMSSDAAAVKATMPDRATRIKTVLEATGEASIKDISDVIRDCSEKTIQRELNQMIDKGEVIRMGERRWSRYAVLK